ncbi:OmpW family protein [Sphingomonas sp. JC676]|uniref:OmpW/AlkL family protein n=1 Tax=Sphingomonas sp. JC676 TaxID=2768065 RepID=UPI00165855AF|nr:OmpW family outer membrane protein [Sphingomonas sp. JC676]MBC9031039.1 OmpW family protein [Sphingomonas sp. JC676]
MLVFGVLGLSPAAAQSVSEPGPNERADDDTGPYVHVGPGALIFDGNAQVKSSGALLPGATVSVDSNVTVITEFGYRWRHFGVSLTGGIPPLATVKGAGTLTPLGTLGRIRYGPTVLTAHYHFTGLGRLQPYIGGGAVLLLIFDNQDGAVNRLRVSNHWGAAVQAGVEYKIAPRLSLYLDVKKAALKTYATGLLSGAPITANIRLNPTVVGGGLSVRF